MKPLEVVYIDNIKISGQYIDDLPESLRMAYENRVEEPHDFIKQWFPNLSRADQLLAQDRLTQLSEIIDTILCKVKEKERDKN